MARFGLLLAAVLALEGSAARAAPLELYGRLPSIEAVAVAPDGASVAVIWTDGEQRKIVFQRLADDKIVEILGLGTAKIRWVQWAGPQHLIITASKTATITDVFAPRDEYFMAYDYKLGTRKLKLLLSDVTESLNTIFDVPEMRIVDGKPMVFVQGMQFVDGQGVISVFRVDLTTGRSRIVETGQYNTRDWLVGQDGEVQAQTIWDPRSGRWSLKVRDHGGWRVSRALQALNDRPLMVGLGRDGRSVLMKDFNDERAVLREVSPEGAWGDPLPIEDESGAIFDPAHHNLIGYYTLVGDEGRYAFFDPQDERVWKAVTKAYPGQAVRLVSWSDDRRKIAVLVDSPTEGPAFALVDLERHKGAWLGGQYEKLRPADISPVRPVRYKAKDGLELTGYLTLPTKPEARNLPLVVFPHGGPAARDEPGFDWWAQAMASRGYAVLQVNYRGSDGFGAKFLEAGFGEWGRKMQTDLSDGVRYLASQGIVDPKRVCIVGASYGGYAAMAGATLDPGVYRCAASVAGPTDMRRFIAWSRTQNGISAQRYWTHFMGAGDLKDPVLAAISPALHADRVDSPVLLVHGKDDTVVPLEQSRFMADALKSAGKPVEFVALDGADHWLLRGDTRLAMLQAVVAFLEKNNPPN
ncbi:S9 family peptidase [Phenylobacterium hankyongense]|uniref:S9 family peptidase n=1 Tax=Phenylobacterium hankyongense TaxID=1813876 RepID=A0A328AZ85_9CAUL|nr:S9 family peptidase [Phenylobacterium hankyongense]RAK60452.1 S9 family peptidase [Phenylobacterium hankyongense]